MRQTMDTSKMIFVFGSNLSGTHGAGAARYAVQYKGAEMGVGEGPTGSCYALPTKGYNITSISLDEVTDHVQKFLSYAKEHPELDFQVTQVGCGLGGFRKEDIAPLFEYAPDNCYFDEMWKSHLPMSAEYWGTF